MTPLRNQYNDIYEEICKSGKEKVSMDADMMYLHLLSISVKNVHLKASEVLKIQQ